MDGAERTRVRIPKSLAWLRRSSDGRAWLARLPELVAEACRRWSLSLGEPFGGGYCSLALPATDRHGCQAVLKLQFPDRESEHEAAALEAWAGNGAVRLLAHAADLRALLIERCVPATSLSAENPDVALAVLAGLVPRLGVAVPGGPFTSLVDEAARWSRNLPQTWERAGRPFERELIDRALEILGRLPATQGPPVLLHQDLHAENVLHAQRERWLVIDPKPIVGELEFGVAPIVRSAEPGDDRESVIQRLDYLCETLELDRDRARDWTIAQTMAWSFEDSQPLAGHLDTVRWLLST